MGHIQFFEINIAGSFKGVDYYCFRANRYAKYVAPQICNAVSPVFYLGMLDIYIFGYD